ncbi:hypothetical protein NHG85_18190, partial [Limimaricola sp. ASW11-118]|nr:hypothetical protein [Limimaricola litoreus]
MGSGFIIGGLWGLIVSAGALAIASLMGEPPRVPQAGSGVVQQAPDEVLGETVTRVVPQAEPDPETLAEPATGP